MRPLRLISPVILLIACSQLLNGAAGGDASNPASMPTNKLTLSYYNFSSGKQGVDINLRHTFKASTGWIGGYREGTGFDQVRMGYQYDYHRDWLTIVPSAQAATRGFLGATLYAETGRTLFAIAGMGRTNLRPYWNLGFDPNDYIQFGAGFRDPGGNTVSVYAIRDNRLGTGQTNTHVFFRRSFHEDWRITLDLVNEHGNGDDGSMLNAWSVSTDVDWRRWFLRLARDPHVNYTADRQVRVSAGVRF